MVILLEDRGSSSKVLALALFALLVISLFPSPASSLEVSDEVNVTDTSDPEGAARTVVDSDGNYHLVYAFNDGGDFDEIMYRKIEADGDTLKGPTKISPTDIDSSLGGLEVAIDASDRVHVVFSLKRTNDDAHDIYYAQLSLDGGVQVSAKSAYSSDVDSWQPHVDADAAGNAYIVWNEETDPPAIHWIKLTSTGTQSRPDQSISDTLGLNGDVSRPRIGVSPSGTSHVVWQHQDNALARWGVHFTALTPSGAEDIAPRTAFSNALYDISDIHADLDSNDRLHITYIGNNNVLYSLVDDDGTMRVSGQEIANPLIGETMAPDVSVDPDDNAYTAYGMRDNPVNAQWNIFARVRYESNDTWSAAERLDPNTVSSYYPRVAAGSGIAGISYLRGSDVQWVTVTPDEENQPPVAVLSVNPTHAGLNQQVNFNGVDSYDPDEDDEVVEWRFDFGDGTDTGWVDDDVRVHAFSQAGTYTARLWVRDNEGLECEDPDTVTVTVSSEPPNKPPTARLTATPQTVAPGETVTFDASSSTDTDGYVAEYNFDFGDGSTTGWAPQSIVTHSYDGDGDYAATVQVKDDEGEVNGNSVVVYVHVEHTNTPPTATIVSISPSPAMEGVDVTFTGQGEDAEGDIAEYSWKSDLDGLLSSVASFIKDDLTIGVHTITFKVEDSDGEWSDPDTENIEIKANQAPTIVDKTTTTKADTDTSIDFRVMYTDPENDMPRTTKLVYGLGGDYKEVKLRSVDATDMDYTDGKEYFYTMKLREKGTYRYWFEFENTKNPKQKSEAKDIVIEEKDAPGPGALISAMAMVVACVLVLAQRGPRRGPGKALEPPRHPSKSVR